MKTKIVYIVTNTRKCGPIQQTLNIIKHLDSDVFEPYLITIYPEDDTSQLNKFLPYVKHFFLPTSKLDIMFNRTGGLKNVLRDISPDIVHSLGVFPDYAISKLRCYKQIMTLRNYVYEDYPAKFGKKGYILAWMHLYAMKHAYKTVTCSESLANIYEDKLNLKYNFIRNGVDVKQYSVPSIDDKHSIRKELGLPKDSFIYVYTGQMIERKNVDFLLDTFAKTFKDNSVYLLLLGGGTLYQGLVQKYGDMENIDFRGNVLNVNHYLKACDAYVSTSKSEGLPNGVLEAMATGLPIVISDIPQHMEVYEANEKIGFVYNQGDDIMLADKMNKLIPIAKDAGKEAYESAHHNFSAKQMSINYQKLYYDVIAE